jgi:hypothetical protein
MLCGEIVETERGRFDLTWVDQNAYQLFASQLPYDKTLNLFCRFIVEAGDDLGNHEMSIVIQSPTYDNVVDPIQINVSRDRAISSNNPFIDHSFEVGFSVVEEGDHWVRLALDEHSGYAVPFTIYVLPDPV